MSSAEYFKLFVREKFAAVAEEIFSVFHNMIVEYEQELDRHRKLFDVAWRPVVKIRRTELPQQVVLKDELIVTDPSSLDQDRNTSLDQEKLELPQAEEQQEELVSSELGLKLERKDIVLCSADDKSSKSEDPAVDRNPEEPLHESEVNIPVITSVVSIANSDLSLYPDGSQSQQLEEDKCENFTSTRPKRKQPNSNFHQSQTDKDQNAPVPKSNTSFTNDSRRKKFKHKSHVPKHRRSHDGRKQRGGKTLESSSAHKTKDIGERPFICSTCGKGFRLWSHLKKHMVFHSSLKAYVCQTCSKTFARKYNLELHERIHTGEKPYVCQTCSKTFARKYNLDLHERIHTGEKPYVCQTCSKTFTQKYNLELHEKIHTGEKPYVCQTCGKACRQKRYLKLHEKRHLSEKPFVCQTCGKGFTHRPSLRQHLTIHTGERPFVCQTCGRAFSVRANLCRHQTVHTGEKPFVCQICNKGFFQKYDLKRHSCKKGLVNSSA